MSPRVLTPWNLPSQWNPLNLSTLASEVSKLQRASESLGGDDMASTQPLSEQIWESLGICKSRKSPGFHSPGAGRTLGGPLQETVAAGNTCGDRVGSQHLYPHRSPQKPEMSSLICKRHVAGVIQSEFLACCDPGSSEWTRTRALEASRRWKKGW